MLTVCYATLIVGIAQAATRPGSSDAACDAIDLRYRSSSNLSSQRELNFFLFDATAQGCTDLTSKFLQAGASVAARDRFGNSALLIAARMGQTQLLDLLLDRGADMHQVNLAGSSALLRAVTMNRRKTAKRLLDLGVDPNTRNKQKISPLVTAAYNGSTRIVRLLLEHGADPLITDGSGKGAVVYAAGRGFLPIVKLLMEPGIVDINTRYGNQLTVLMWAAGHSNDVPESDAMLMIDYLLLKGADLKLLDNRGRSALMIAAERGHAHAVQRLLEQGANSTLVDSDQKTALDLADDTAVRQILKSHQAR